MARIGQHPWLLPGLKIPPTRIGYCSSTRWANHSRCDDNNVVFTNVQPHYYHVQQVEPCYRLGEVARRSSWAIGLFVLYFYKINFTTTARSQIHFAPRSIDYISRAKHAVEIELLTRTVNKMAQKNTRHSDTHKFLSNWLANVIRTRLTVYPWFHSQRMRHSAV